MKSPYKRATAYLNDAEYARLLAVANASGRTVSGHVKHIIERDLASASIQQIDLLPHLTAIQIGVDALIRNHPNVELHRVVAEVRAARLKGASHEA
jgi:hypothetical protein